MPPTVCGPGAPSETSGSGWLTSADQPEQNPTRTTCLSWTLNSCVSADFPWVPVSLLQNRKETHAVQLHRPLPRFGFGPDRSGSTRQQQQEQRQGTEIRSHRASHRNQQESRTDRQQTTRFTTIRTLPGSGWRRDVSGGEFRDREMSDEKNFCCETEVPFIVYATWRCWNMLKNCFLKLNMLNINKTWARMRKKNSSKRNLAKQS